MKTRLNLCISCVFLTVERIISGWFGFACISCVFLTVERMISDWFGLPCISCVFHTVERIISAWFGFAYISCSPNENLRSQIVRGGRGKLQYGCNRGNMLGETEQSCNGGKFGGKDKAILQK